MLWRPPATPELRAREVRGIRVSGDGDDVYKGADVNRDYWRGRARGLREAVGIIEAGVSIGLPLKDALEVLPDVASTIEFYVRTRHLSGLRSMLNRRELRRNALP